MLDGHADYNAGNDIVCAAISAVGMMLAGAITNLVPDNLRTIETDSGHIDITVDDSSVVNNTAFEVCFIGLKQIEQSYPENLKIDTLQINRLPDFL